LHIKGRTKIEVFEKRVLRKIVGPKRDVIMRSWRKQHNGELHNLSSSSDSIRMIQPQKMRWVGNVAHMERMTNVYKILVGKSEGKRLLGKTTGE
jgi:hypothetical protein